MKTTSIRVSQNTSRRMSTVSGAVLTTTLFAAILFGGVSVQAATYNWTNGVPDNSYTNKLDWNPNGLPGISDTAIIGNAGTPNPPDCVYTNVPPDPASTNKLSELEMGNAAGTSAINMTGGVLWITNTSTAYSLGNASGGDTATFTQSGGTLVVARPSNSTLYYQDSFIVGAATSSTNTYTISGGLADILCGVEIANNASSTCVGIFNINGGTVIDNGWFGICRQNNATASFNMTAGTLYILRNMANDSAGNACGLSLSQGNPGTGTANISGGTLYFSNIHFNPSASATEALNISGGNLYIGYLGVIYGGVAASQPINISGGTFHTVDMLLITTSANCGNTNTILSDGTNWSWAVQLPVNLTNGTFSVNGVPGPGYVTFAPETNRTITLNNNWSGVGGMYVSGASPGSTVALNGSNSFSGLLQVTSGTATLGAPQYFTGGTVVYSSGTVAYNAAQPASIVSGTTIQSGGTLGIGAVQTNAIFGVATLDAGSTVALNSGAGLISSPLNISGITLDFNAGNVTQLFTNDVSGSGTVLATLGGTGDEWTTGNLGHSGTTTVSSGALIVNGTLNDSSGVTVTNTGMLAGNGVIDSPITVYGSGQLQPGLVEASGMAAAPGILTVGNLTFKAGSVLNIKVGSTTNDLLVVNGNLNIDPTAVLNILPLGQLTPGGVYVIATYSGAIAGSFASAIGGLTRYGLSVDYGTPNEIKLDVSNVQTNANLTWVGATNGVLNGNWYVLGTVSNWFNGANADIFYEGDAVTFDDTASNFSAVLTTTLYPSSITFNDSSNYSLTGSGSGRITGSTGITKNGNGTVTLASGLGIDNDYTGPVQINAGILKMNGLKSLGATNGNTTVASGATLDLNSYNPGSEPIILTGSGFGSGTNGALNNSGGTLSGNNGPLNITLNGDTTIGSNPGRLDIGNSTLGAGGGSFAGTGYNLTKVGAADTWLHELGDIGVNNINVNQGTFGLQYTISAGMSGGTISVAPGAEFGMWQVTNAAGGINKNLSLTTATFYSYSPGGSVTNTFLGPITLSGTNTLNVSGTGLNLSGAVGGTGGFQVIGGGPLYLQAANLYSGPTFLNSGRIVLGFNGLIADSSLIQMASGTILDASGTMPGGLTLSSGQTLAGSGSMIGYVSAGTGTTLSPGSNLIAGTLVFTNNLTLNGDTNIIKLSSDRTQIGGANDLLSVNGTLTLSGNSTIMVTPIGELDSSQPYIVMLGGSISGGAGNLTAVSTSPRYSVTASISGNYVEISASGNAAQLEWFGNVPGHVGIWDFTTTNWYNLGTAKYDTFYNGDDPIFDDSSSVTNVVITNNVTPAGIYVSNVNNTYTFSGGGVIGGALNMEGNGSSKGGTLILAMSNTPAFTTIDSAYGTLVFALRGLTNYVINTPIGDNEFTYASTIIFGGTNTAVLTADNAGQGFDGIFMVTNGVLQYTNADALGLTSQPFIITNSGTLDFNGVPVPDTLTLHISGNGFNGQGALTSSKGIQDSGGAGGAFTYLTLDGDASVGSPLIITPTSTNNIRWDQNNPTGTGAGQVNGNGYKLTKVGGGAVFFYGQVDGDTHLGDIDVAAGRLAFQSGPVTLGNDYPNNVLSVESNAICTFYGVSNQFDAVHYGVNKAMWLKGNDAGFDSGGNNPWTNNFDGPVFLTGTNIIDTRSALHLWGNVMDTNGPGGFILGDDSGFNSSLALYLDGTANTYSGPTIISNATLVVDAGSSLGLTSLIQVNSGASLDLSALSSFDFGTTATNQTMIGNGTVIGPSSGNLNFNSGSTLAVGFPGGTYTLTMNGNLVFNTGSTNDVVVNKTVAGPATDASDEVVGLTSVTLGGTLVITNIGANPLVASDVIPLFSATTYNLGGFTTNNIVPNAPGSGLAWDLSHFTSDGTLRVLSTVTVNPNPTNIVFSVTGNQLTLSWPMDHTGWTLQAQTNSLAVGIYTNWVDVSGSTTTNQVIIPINLTNGCVFYRLVYPAP